MVCYFCGTLESDWVVIQLASGQTALDPTHSVAAGLPWRAGLPLCPRRGGAVFLDDIHISPISRHQSFAARSRRAAAGQAGVGPVLEIFRAEISRTLGLLGMRSVADIDASVIHRPWLRAESD